MKDGWKCRRGRSEGNGNVRRRQEDSKNIDSWVEVHRFSFGKIGQGRAGLEMTNKQFRELLNDVYEEQQSIAAGMGFKSVDVAEVFLEETNHNRKGNQTKDWGFIMEAKEQGR